MNNEDEAARLPVTLDLAGLAKRKLLEAELFSRSAQLAQFTPIRDRLTAFGQDPNESYRQILARQQELANQLHRGVVWPGSTAPSPKLSVSLFDLPISAAVFNPAVDIFQFGYSGYVQMGRATEGVFVTPGVPDTFGGIDTIGLAANGAVTFGGVISQGTDNEEIPPGQYDPSIQYFWLHNWTNIVPFPAPTVTSYFTCRFDVSALANVFRDGGDANLMSFVSLGETANFKAGETITLDQTSQWPLNTDLTHEVTTGGLFNGFYGFLDGKVTVQRSFLVQAGQVPALAVVLGVVSGISMGTKINFTSFSDIGPSGITPLQTGGSKVGLVSFHYTPQLEVSPVFNHPFLSPA